MFCFLLSVVLKKIKIKLDSLVMRRKQIETYSIQGLQVTNLILKISIDLFIPWPHIIWIENYWPMIYIQCTDFIKHYYLTETFFRQATTIRVFFIPKKLVDKCMYINYVLNAILKRWVNPVRVPKFGSSWIRKIVSYNNSVRVRFERSKVGRVRSETSLVWVKST